MKKITFLLFILGISCLAQNPNIDLYMNELTNELQRYDGDDFIIQDSYLDSELDKLFRAAIFDNNNLTANASAFSFEQNSDNTLLSASINTALNGEGRNQYFLKTGFFAKGKDNVFNIYSNESWSNETGFNLGFIWKFNGSIFTDSKNKKKINKKRKVFTYDLVEKKKEYDEIKDKLYNIQSHLQNIIAKNNASTIDDVKSILNSLFKLNENSIASKLKKRFTDNNSEYSFISDTIPDIIKNNESWLNKEKSTINKKVLRKELAEFDKNHVKINQYSLWWFDLNFSISNATYSFSNDSIFTQFVSAGNQLEKFKRRVKLANSLNFNYLREKENHVWYLQAGTSTNTSTFLDNDPITEAPILATGSGENSNILYVLDPDNPDNPLGRYDELEKPNTFGSVYLYSAFFYKAKKNLGININFQHDYLISRSDNALFRNNYTILFGPLFRISKDDTWGKTTFGLDVGYENALYGEKAKEFFIAKLKIGVPFSAFVGKKK